MNRFKRIIAVCVLGATVAAQPLCAQESALDLAKTSLVQASVGILTMLGTIAAVRGFFWLRDRLHPIEKPEPGARTTFADVVGYPEVISEVQEVVTFLNTPEKYAELGAQLPKGIILYGPPGTGKTTLARAIAGEARADFFSISGSELNGIIVGQGAQKIRQLFDAARRCKKAVIFIDEIDVIASSRYRASSSEPSGAVIDGNYTITELLTQIDGFKQYENIVVVGATNTIASIDPALLRAGRLDRKVEIPLPHRAGRRAILQYYLERMPCIDGECAAIAEQFAALTSGFSGAGLKQLVNEAALLAAREKCSTVSVQHVADALDKISMGLARPGEERSPDLLRRIAYHEAGHAILAVLCNVPLIKVTILGRGDFAGYAHPDYTGDVWSERELYNDLTIRFGGFVAEDLVFGSVSVGVANDLQTAHNMAIRMVRDCGMASGDLRALLPPESVGLEEVKHILTRARDEARQLLAAHRETLDTLAQELLEHETLSGAEVKALVLGQRVCDGDCCACDEA